MNDTESGLKPSCDGSENDSQICTTIPSQEADFLNPSRRSKRLQKDDLLESKKSEVLPANKELLNQKREENERTTQIASTSEISSCSKNIQSETAQYLFGLYDQDIDSGHSLTHRFYGCKRKGFPSPCSESFGLPDDPIFSNSPIFLDRTRKPPLDIDLADPWDISVVDLEYVDQPWLVEYPEVITPYWDVESLFPFEVEDIRQKLEPEDNLSKQRTLSDSFNISNGILDASAENGGDNVFTSTPVKDSPNSLSVVSTINITNGQDNNVDITALKDEVLKALEEAIKQKSTIGNIDMKIQIVTSDLTSPVTSPKKSSVEVRINENVETESCRSSSSSKENYCIENVQGPRETSKNLTNAKEASKVPLSDLNEDWQDSPVSDVNDQSQNELNECVESGSAKKSKKLTKNRKKGLPGVRRSLRSQESNMSTTVNKNTVSISDQLGLEDNSIDISKKSKTSLKIKTSEYSKLENISLSKEISSQQAIIIDTPNKQERESHSKRVLRSSNQFSDKKDISDSESNIISKESTKKPLKPFQKKDDIISLFGKQKQKGKHTNEGLQLNQGIDCIDFVDKSRRQNRFRDEDSQTDESDCTSFVGRRKQKRKFINEALKFSGGTDGNEFNAKSRRSSRFTNEDSQTSQDESDCTSFVGKQKQKGTLTNKELQLCQGTNGIEFMDKFRRKRNCNLANEDSQTSQDESDNNEAFGRNRLRVRKTRQNRYLQSSPDKNILKIFIDTDLQTSQNIDISRIHNEQALGNNIYSSQDVGNIIKVINKKPESLMSLQSCQNDTSRMREGKPEEKNLSFIERTLSSCDESDMSKKIVDIEKTKRKGRFQNVDSQQLVQSESDIRNIVLESSYKDILQFNQSESDIDKYVERKLRARSLKEDLHSSQDESDVSKDDVNRTKRRGRPPKAKVEKKHNDVLVNANHQSSVKMNNQPIEKALDSKKEEIEIEDMSPFKRKLRSSTHQLSPVINQTREKRRRTFSSSASEKVSREQNVLPGRRRSVSANYDSERTYSPPPRRFLRSQVAEVTKISVDLKSPVCETVKNSNTTHNNKSPKITFNLTNSFKESPRKFDIGSPIKSILKNVYDSTGRLIGVKVHREKHVKMPKAIEIKPEDKDDSTSSKKELTHQTVVPTELELNSIKKEEEECLKENGITSRIKIVISPLDIKEEVEDKSRKTDPILPLDVPKNLVTPLRKSGRKSQENAVENKSESAVKLTKNDDKNIDDKIQLLEVKEIKIEETDYSLGNFVWAQVGKYPFWPAIICNDPITQAFRKEVIKLNRLPQLYYHIRFFGDNGRRAWVLRKHIMLFCSDQDLELIANKLKSENKSHYAIKPYLVLNSIEKWRKAVEELNSMKTKKYDNIIKHMLESFKNHIKNRRKRSFMDASSESESEEPDPSGNNRRKKFKASEYPHITADAQLDNNTFQSNGSEGFDEINISIGVQKISERLKKTDKDLEALNSTFTPTTSDNAPFTQDADQISEAAENSEMSSKVTPRRSRRSLKPIESLNITLESCLETPESSETTNESSVKLSERRSLRAPRSAISNELSSTRSVESKKQTDERSEAESKSSSDLSNSKMYSFEYQMELHKKNNLFNGLRNVKVCDYCLKPGDLYKCKGRCGGFFHLDCASKVTQPHNEKKAKKREKSPTKVKVQTAPPSLESTPKSNRVEERCITRNQCQVQIITIKSKHAIGTPKKVNLPANFDELSLSEQIDYGMKEMMSKFENRTIYLDSTDSSSEEGSIIASKNKQLGILDSPVSSVAVESEKSAAKSSDLDENGEEEKSSDDLEVSTSEKSNPIKHVTADSVILTEGEMPMDITNMKCTYCRLELDPPCFACGLEVSLRGSSIRRKCSQYRCGRYYHPYCLKMWPQTQWSIGKWSRNQEQEDSFTCPAHTCHTCFSEELGSAACRLPGDKLARCMLCPAGFHTTTFCIPAGTEILGGSQIVCPRHRSKLTQPINTIWCFICSEGGNLICCDACPTSVHPECQPINLTDDDKYICEDCESGRFPLYDEIVWVKLGQYRWWPAVVLFPNEIPENVRALKHQRGDFAVRFFGTNDHYWVNKARSFLFQEGDRGGSPGEGNKSKNKVYESFGKAIEDAALAYKLKKEFKLRREAESISSLKPPTYVKINKNKPVGNVKSLELDLSNATACECDPNKPHPCGPDTNCINRLLMTECDPDVCPAGNRCRNQAFQKREYPPMIPYKTQGRGWGLKCLAPIKKGQFVIEYVGELIDSEEYQRRIQKMHEQKEENYYFMTVDSDRMIDAGPKGNLSRFMNHCCNPNCVTQKWTVRGDTRVGLFAKCDIESGSELTFNYNLEVVGQEKKVCKCGASNCSGFIGVKVKSDKPEKPQTDLVTEPTDQRRPRKYNKKRTVSPVLIPPCFMCGRKQSDLTCNNKFCNKGYHLKCLKLEEMPEVAKFTCPRHNCNICSNRTIRCCVKCTNSFCPSHSEGNVRHDKFLGFVCRLHDPGISSPEITSLRMRENGSSKTNKPRNKSIYSFPPEEREAIRAAWRLRKRQEYDRKKIVKINSNGNKGKGKRTKANGLKQKVQTSTSSFGRKTKKISTQRKGVKIFKSEKRNNLNNPLIKYNKRLQKGNGGILNVPKEDKAVIRSMWRESKRSSRLKQKEKLEQAICFGVQSGNIHTQVNDDAATESDPANNQENVTDIPQKEAPSAQDDIENINDDVVKTIIENTPATIQYNHITDTKDDAEHKIQNNLTSENQDGTIEISDVTQSERSEFEPIKSIKRRRQKADSTDELTVSSTTSDEDSNSKAQNSHKLSQKETSNVNDNELERDDSVSSTPPKELSEIIESKESQSNININTSDDEVTLDKRMERLSGVRNPRKKIRINIKKLASTATTS